MVASTPPLAYRRYLKRLLAAGRSCSLHSERESPDVAIVVEKKDAGQSSSINEPNPPPHIVALRQRPCCGASPR
jgi:hypothetical protein